MNLSFVVVSAVGMIGGIDSDPITAGSRLEAGRTFQKNCLSCHQPPDLKYETDRAWLDQIYRTA